MRCIGPLHLFARRCPENERLLAHADSQAFGGWREECEGDAGGEPLPHHAMQCQLQVTLHPSLPSLSPPHIMHVHKKAVPLHIASYPVVCPNSCLTPSGDQLRHSRVQRNSTCIDRRPESVVLSPWPGAGRQTAWRRSWGWGWNCQRGELPPSAQRSGALCSAMGTATCTGPGCGTTRSLSCPGQVCTINLSQ